MMKKKSLNVVIAGLAASLASGLGHAAGMNQLIQDAISRDPAILEAQANEEVAAMRTKASHAQHYPVLGTQAGVFVSNPDDLSRPFRGVVGRVNVFAAGAIESAVKRDGLREAAQKYKTEETREVIAVAVANLYLEALRAQELLAVEQKNLERHNKIIRDLKIVVENDRGRQYELVQAEARAFQVHTRIVQYEKTTELALAKLSRYTPLKPTAMEPILQEWRDRLGGIQDASQEAVHPTLAAQKQELEATREGHRTLFLQRFPRLDLEVGKGSQTYSRLNVNWDFFDRSADYNVQTVSKEIQAAEQRADLLSREIAQRAQTARTDMDQSQREIAVAKNQIEASKKVAELYELQFKVGRRTLIELVNAYQELASVELSFANAENNYRQAFVNYLDSQALLSKWAAN